MGRIDEDIIDRMKLEISLKVLAHSQGYELKSHGAEFALCCPFHDDKTPSCYINPEKNVFYCHGCGEKGDVIQWLMKTERMSFREACDRLLAELGIQTELTDADDQALLRQVIEHYHSTLRSSVVGQDYLKSRGLYDAELVKTFQLGFVDRSLMQCIPGSRRTSQPMREQLKRIGILRESGREHLEGCIVVPILDGQQKITQVYGRRVNKSKEGINHLYLPQPQTGIWNLDAFSQKEIILCESLIDAMSFWVHGFRNVTASYGAKGLNKDLQAAIQKYGVESVKIAYDRDAAGDGAALAVATELAKDNIGCYRVQFPKGMDTNEYALKMQPANKALQLVLDKAELMLPVEFSSSAAPVPEPEVIKESQSNPLTIDGDDVYACFGARNYRVRGLDNNANRSQLKINLLVRTGDQVHVDQLDLYQSKARNHYLNQAAKELGLPFDVLKRDISKLLLQLEELQDSRVLKDQTPKTKELSRNETDQALELLQDVNLMERILSDLDTLGLVGEETNKLVGYLAAVSRKLEKPLAIMIQSTSAAGKSSLMDVVLQCVPEEERIHYSAMTGQSLFYMGETNLKHKILSIAEEEGAEQACYALKLLQSEGEIRIASTGKDAKTGQLVTQEYRVEGPVMLFMTTTAIDVDPELLNRCLTLTVNESCDQTIAIHRRQRREETLKGLLKKSDRSDLLSQHQNAQRLLKPVNVVNPYAENLTFVYDQTRTRRDHKKYLSLIRAITLLHQYQRPLKMATYKGVTKEYIEVTVEDIRWANRLAHEVLGRTLDELPPQTRKLLGALYEWVRGKLKETGLSQIDFRFTRKQVREATHWSNTQVRIHLERLEELEYVIVHGGGRGKVTHYELLYNGEGGNEQPFLMGLADADLLTREQYDLELAEFTVQLAEQGVENAGSKRYQNGLRTGLKRSAESEEYAVIKARNTEMEEESKKCTSMDIISVDRIVQGAAHGG